MAGNNLSSGGSGSGGNNSNMSSTSSRSVLSSVNNETKERDHIWYFTAEQLANSPSRRHGISADQELSFRQMTAYLIQEMGQLLKVSQLCINTAIVYMHRFYAFHSFTHFSRNGIASASLFLAAKVEEQPYRKLEQVITASQKCLGQPITSASDPGYMEQAQDLVFNENVLLQTLGFDVAIDHPHTYVVKTCHLVKACKDLVKTSYFLASNSLHLTSMCLQYRPTVVACFCIYLACKWSRWEIPQSTEGKHWFYYVDKSVTMELLKQLTDEFIAIYDKSPTRLKSKLNSIKALAQGASNRIVSKDKKSQADDWKMSDMMKIYHSSIPTDTATNGGGMSISQQMQYHQQEQQQTLPSLSSSSSSQQQRRSESHSSHHRVHHSSGSHHHSKQVLPPNELGDHKSSLHKQPYPPVSRPQRDPSQPYSTALGHNSTSSSGSSNSSSSSSKQMQPPLPPPAISSRPSSTQGRQSMSSVPQLSQQRPPPQAHDPNYHKSSSRSNAIPPPPQLNPPPTIPNHKILSKTDPSGNNRMMHKDPSRQIDTNKMSSNKMYPMPSSAQNVGVDMTRTMLQQNVSQQQRPYSSQIPNNNNNSQPPPSSIHPTTYPNKTTSLSNSKYEQQLSVQMQQQQQIIHQQHQKQQQQQQQPLIESSYNPQHTGSKSSMSSYQYMRQQVDDNFAKQSTSSLQNSDQMELCSPPKYSQYTNPQGFVPPTQPTQQQQQPPPAQQQQQQSKPSSIFSPEWNEKPHQPPMNNGSKTGSASTFKTTSRDSPKKSDRSTPKKDKTRSSSSSSTSSSSILPSADMNNTTLTQRQSQNSAQMFGMNKPQQQQKQEQGAVIPPPPTYASSYGLAKRPSSSLDHGKTDEEQLIRDSKVRKLDATAPTTTSPPITSAKTSAASYTAGTVNGIETNPDLVSCLLKESLCTENKFSTSGFIKTEQPPSIIKSEYQDPMQMFDPNMTTLPEQILQNPPAAIKEEQVVSADMEIDDYTNSSVKLEKKKKKDKHKHKEKDKSKDKEERKKHKKDKDRHKDRERERERASETSEASEPVKIKISKDKINLSTDASSGPAQPVLGFKIKIPKERITSDISSNVNSGTGTVGGGSGPGHEASNAPVVAPPLKIKISKDKIESYSSSGGVHQQSSVAPMVAGSYQYHGNSINASGSGTSGGTSTNSSSSSSKKKDRDRDRDREREKEKKRSSHDHSKMNGSSNIVGSNGGGNVIGNSAYSSMSAATAAAAAAAATLAPGAAVNNSSSSSKGQISNKIHQYNNSSDMSHLFGESNDDDDDDDDDDEDDDSDSDDIGISSKLPPTTTLSSTSSSSYYKSNSSSSHGSSRYSSSDNRYNNSGSNSMQQKFSHHRRQSSSTYQKNNNW